MKAKVTVTPQDTVADDSIFTPGNLVVSISNDAIVCVSRRKSDSRYAAGTFSGIVISNPNTGEYSDVHTCRDYKQYRGTVILDTTGE